MCFKKKSVVPIVLKMCQPSLSNFLQMSQQDLGADLQTAPIVFEDCLE